MISNSIWNIFKRRSNRTAGSFFRRRAYRLVVALGIAAVVSISAGQAQDTNAPGETATNAPPALAPPSVPAPIASTLSTNPASSSFLQSHPEQDQAPPRAPDLTLRPSSSPPDNETASPGLSPGESEPQPPLTPSLLVDPQGLAAHLLVVFNIDDTDSKDLALYYASRRGIPPERVLAISCPSTEEVTRKQYETTVREPIISYLIKKNWMLRRREIAKLDTGTTEVLVATFNNIWAIVLMRGVPLKIANDPLEEDSLQVQPEFATNAAAVDSELAMLPVFGLPRGGYVPNPFYDGRMTGEKRAGPQLATNLILVTRLDGPTPVDVRRMIDDSLYAEQNRLAGLAVVDSRGITDHNDHYFVGDVWMRAARDFLLRDGWSVKFDDRPDLIPPTDPLNHVAIYLGWYSGSAYGPWFILPHRFARGAIAYHLHSFSASTVRDFSGAWVGPLIANGAAASMGTVYEPYLILTPHLDIFTKRLLAGETFAEAAYACQPGLSWMTTVVGDPLYRPFVRPLDSALADAGETKSAHHDWLLLQQVRRQISAGEFAPTLDNLEQRLDSPDAGAVAHEGLGDLLATLPLPLAKESAEAAFKRAMEQHLPPVDEIRLGLKLVQLDLMQGQKRLAQNELKRLAAEYPVDAERFGVLDQFAAAGLPPAKPPGDENAPTPAPIKQLISAPAPVPVPPAPSRPSLPVLPKPPGEA